MEGWRGSKLSKRSTMEERERVQKSWATIGEENPLNRLPQKPTVGGRFAQGRYYRPTHFSPPTALKRTRSSGTAARGGGTTAGVKQKASTAAVLAALLAVLHNPGEGSKSPAAVLPPEVAVLLLRANRVPPWRWCWWWF